jgi:energy-coupling factor transporter ATP-binding protein EcfA2
MSQEKGRAIRLARLHALNWYGYRDSIAVDGNLLLAGVTGSGKSILMDLIQFVLVGDLRLVKFNQSATGDRSDRTLKGYCLGDTKQEEAGVTQYMRDSAITYVAMEFTWPGGKRVETWGFRMEFTSAAEQRGSEKPFFIPASLTRADFLDEEKRPLSHAAFKAMAESHTTRDGVTGRLYAELGEYLRDMCQPSHLNFDRSVLRSLLPSAMSFTFLKSFNQFCRDFILPADRLDVRDVTDSYKAFIGYERQLTELRDQHARLDAIAKHFQTHAGLRRDAVLARWLDAECHRDHAATALAEGERALAELNAACAEENARLAVLAENIPKLRGELEALRNSIRATPGGDLYLDIKGRNTELVAKIGRLRDVGRSLDSALANRVHGAREWVKAAAALPLELDTANVATVERGIAAMEAGGIAKFHPTFHALRDAAQKLAADVSRLAQPTHKRLADIRAELGQLREQIAALAIGKLPFPTRLLDTLNNSLLARGADLPARHLRELCEVNDERWRPAIEVAFTRKFAVVVDAADYDAAEKLYHQLREAAAGESLVNPAKVQKRAVQPGSLAEKVTASHPVAMAVVSQLFGGLMCVERREQLREHDAAIMPDGFMARGAFVERTRHYDNLPFVGKRGLEQQRAFKERQRDEFEAEERRLRPLAEAVEEVQREWRTFFDPPASLWQDLAAAKELHSFEEQLEGNIARLNQIDRAKFDDLAQRDSELTTEIATLEKEQVGLLGSAKRHHFSQQEKVVTKLAEEADARKATFDRVNGEADVSQWLPRLGELRDEMLAAYPAKDVAAERFNTRFHEADKGADAEWERVKAARRELALTHPKFDDLAIEAADNAAYDKQLAKLSDADIPNYADKSTEARRRWEKLFRTQVLEKLRSALSEVENTRQLLNNLLKRPIGNNRYRIVKWENPDFAIYHKLLGASALAHEDELFFASADADLRGAIEKFLTLLVEQPDGKATAELLDYRHYYDYDMEVDDLDELGAATATSRVDRQSGKFSGGENQSPYFIAILASYLRAYKRHDTRSKAPSLALVPIDEAFSKLSGERIKNCIEALAQLDLQGVFSMSTGNIPYAFEHCDSLVVVSKDERRIGKRLAIRNTPVSLHKDSPEARRLLGLK